MLMCFQRLLCLFFIKGSMQESILNTIKNHFLIIWAIAKEVRSLELITNALIVSSYFYFSHILCKDFTPDCGAELK